MNVKRERMVYIDSKRRGNEYGNNKKNKGKFCPNSRSIDVNNSNLFAIYARYSLMVCGLFERHKPEPEIGDFLPYYILKTGNMAISLGLLFVTLIAIRRYNKDL